VSVSRRQFQPHSFAALGYREVFTVSCKYEALRIDREMTLFDAPRAANINDLLRVDENHLPARPLQLNEGGDQQDGDQRAAPASMSSSASIRAASSLQAFTRAKTNSPGSSVCTTRSTLSIVAVVEPTISGTCGST